MNLFFRHTRDAFLISCQNILDFYDIRYTSLGLRDYFESHPDHPSLLSLKDVIEKYGIKSAAMRKGEYTYDNFELPFVCAIQRSDWPSPAFSLVTDVGGDQITYSDPFAGKVLKGTLSDFDKIDKGVVLLLEGEDKRDEANILLNQKKERVKKFMGGLPYVFAFVFLLFPLFYQFEQGISSFTWLSSAFLLTSFAGLIFTFVLIWFEIDSDNSFVREVCGGGKSKSFNCGAVLNSPGSSFLGITWSSWGFAYFSTFFVSQVFYVGSMGVIKFWIIVSVLVSPYIVYSLIYQWKTVKQWCPMCVATQGVLFINLIISLVVLLLGNNFLSGRADWYPLAMIFVLGLIFLFVSHFGVQELSAAKNSKDYERRWKRLKYDPDIFKSFLEKSGKLPMIPDDLGIVVGNRDAGNEIIKVCNPYCVPCSRAHPELGEIVQRNSDVKVRIIFTATGEEDDIRTAPVGHLLAIEEKMGRDIVQKALDDWYLAGKKDYKEFSVKYPMNGELREQKGRMVAMDKWCQEMKVRATPTLFINGYELPEIYRIDELKNFL